MKTKIVFALIAFLMLGSVNLNAQENGNSQNSESTNSLEGDLNHDGKVNAADITYLVNIIMNIEKSQDDTNPISVTGVSISPSPISLNIGETQEITATVLPSNATNKSVTWHSSNSSIATVNSSGIVTGVSAGTATITATTVDGGYTASSTITVSNNSGSNPTTYYWYIGTENPSSTSDIQTSNTVAGWHEIGSSLSGFVLDTNRTIVTVSEEERVPYYIVIPNDLHIYNALDMNVEELLFNSVTCNIPGYKSFRNKPRNGIDGAYDVTGIILKQ